MTDQEWMAAAARVIPGGANTLSKRPGYATMLAPGLLPLVTSGHPHPGILENLDGMRWTDLVSGLGCVMFGHEGHSVPHVAERELSDELTRLLPGAEQVKLFSSGTEACMAAMATARAYTGKTIIVTSDQSYHGWSDQYRAVKPDHPGVPEPMTRWIRTFVYNDLVDLARVLDECRGDVAAVMMEPALVEPPQPGFLEGVRDLAHAVGAVVVWDEMLLGFRLAIGGGSEYFGVTPDLATYGKPLGGGYPLAALVGRAAILEHALFASGTFCGHGPSCEAALATVRRYQRDSVITRLHAVGQGIVDAIMAAITETQAPLRVVGFPVLPILRWTVPDPGLILQSLLQQELGRTGVFMHSSGRLIPSLALESIPPEFWRAAFTRACAAVVSYLQTGAPGLKGPPIRQTGIRQQPAWEVPA